MSKKISTGQSLRPDDHVIDDDTRRPAFTIDPHADWPIKSPFRPGEEVILPKGVEVRTMHPSRDSYVTARSQKVRIDHCLPGRFVSVGEALREYRPFLEKDGFDLSTLEEWRDRNAPEFYRRMVMVDQPTVRWAGSGGYWCEVPEVLVEKLEN